MTDKPDAATPVVDDYLHGLRTELADLPAPELSEIMDDARSHLTELAAELDPGADRAALVARIGTPTAYAAELRAAAGYPPAPSGAAPRSPVLARVAIGALVAGTLLITATLWVRSSLVLVGFFVVAAGLVLVLADGPTIPSVRALPLVRSLVGARPEPGTPLARVLDFVAGLQPAWWVLRAVAAAYLVGRALGSEGGVGTVLLAMVAVPVSVWVGYRSRADRRLLWAVVPLNAVAAVLVLFGAVLLLDPGRGSQSVSSGSSYQPGLSQDGQPIEDIRPFDSYGNALSRVYLFDQTGRLLDTSGSDGCFGSGAGNPALPYPRGTRDYDPRTQGCVVIPPAPLVVAVPTAAPTSAAAPTTAPR